MEQKKAGTPRKVCVDLGINVDTFTHKVCEELEEYGNGRNSRCKYKHPDECIRFYEGIIQRNNCWYLHLTKINNGKQATQQEHIE